MAATEKIDRLAMCLYRSLLDADRQTNGNPTVFFRCLERGFENYLHGEGYTEAVFKAIEVADAKVRIACFCIDPNDIAPFAMARARGEEPEAEDLGGYQDPAYERNGR